MIKKREIEDENKIIENTRFEPLRSHLHSRILIVLILSIPIFILLTANFILTPNFVLLTPIFILLTPNFILLTPNFILLTPNFILFILVVTNLLL